MDRPSAMMYPSIKQNSVKRTDSIMILRITFILELPRSLRTAISFARLPV